MVTESQGSFGVVGSAVGGLIVFGFDGEVGSITVAVGRGAVFGGIGGWWSSLKGDHALFVHCVYSQYVFKNQFEMVQCMVFSIVRENISIPM